MSRWIDAEYVKAVMLNDRLMQGNAEFNLYAQQVEIQVKAMPSIDIVRCAECIERDDDWCMYWQNVVNVYDFCSYGERREP